MPLWVAPCDTPGTVFQGYPKAPYSLTSSETSWQVTIFCPILLPPAYLHMWWPIIITEYPRLLRSGTGTPSELTGKWQGGHASTHSDSLHQGCEDDYVRMAPSRASTNGSQCTMATAPPASLGKCQKYRLPAWARVGLRLREAVGVVQRKGECH